MSVSEIWAMPRRPNRRVAAATILRRRSWLRAWVSFSLVATTSAELYRDLEAALVAQQDRTEAVLRISHEGGVVGVLALVVLDIVAHHDRAGPQLRRHDVHDWPHQRDPAVEQQE